MTKLARRAFLKSAAAVGAAAVFPMPAIAKDLKGSGEVVVFDGGGSWGEAKRIVYFEPFEAETGIRVIAEPRTEGGAIRASIMAGAPRYDVCVLPGGVSGSFARDGLLEHIDYSFFEQADLDGFQSVKPSDVTIPHILYSVLLAYDAGAFPDATPQNWADMWDTEKFPGGRSMGPGAWGGEAATFEAALLADGVQPADLYPLDFDRAFASLTRLRPNIVKFWDSGAEGPQLLTDKQVTMATAWNGRIADAKEQGANVGFTWNQGILQYDDWAILKGAANVENASKFLAFAARADRQAEFVKHILYAPPNANAYEFIAPERAALLPTSPEAAPLQIVQNYDFWNAIREDGTDNTAYAASLWERWIAG